MKRRIEKVKRFAPRHSLIDIELAWLRKKRIAELEELRTTRLPARIKAILASPAYGKDDSDSLFWKLAEVVLEMAQKIEVLERKTEEHHDRLMELFNSGEL